MKRRGLSPIIATVLLVAIVIMLALVIFFWARSFLAERAQKFNEPAENACSRINFDAEAFIISGRTYIDVVNRGNVPLYGIEVRKRGLGTLEAVGTFKSGTNVIRNGETGRILVPSGAPADSELELLPIILAEKGIERTPYTCERDAGQTVSVQG